jgi:DNA-directed RNA polymerase specialized sigma24 family protein
MLLSLPMIGATVALVLSLALLATLVILKRKQAEQRLTSQRLATLQQKIATALDDDATEAERAAFGVALKAARLTTELQRPRLETMAKLDRQPPEKYRILSTLAAQGMASEEIASLLGISPMEANQLLSLCTVGKGGR